MASDLIALALIRELCRGGALDSSEIERMAIDLDAAGHGDEAHLVRCQWIKAGAPTQAEFRRSKIKLVTTGEE